MKDRFIRSRQLILLKSDESMPRKRPFSVTLLLWMVLSLLAWGVVRIYASLRWWDVLVEFRSSLSPLYLSVTGAGWVIVGVVLLWSMWLGKAWIHRAILTSVLVWLIEYWIERVFYQAARANLPFAIVSSLFVVCIALVSTFHKSTQNYFIKKRGV
jgi:hypothetical protein